MIARNSRRRVVVTGVGVINPLGNDIQTLWANLKEGKSGVGYTSIFDASNFPTKISAEIKDWDIASAVADPELWKLRGRHTRFAAGAATQAFQASGVNDHIKDRRRFGVYMDPESCRRTGTRTEHARWPHRQYVQRSRP